MSIDIPVSGKARFEYDINKQEHKYVFDDKNFLPNTNKIEEIGRLRKHKIVVKCNGRGGFIIIELSSVEDRLKRAKKMRDDNLITEQQFQTKQQEILRSL